MWPRVWYPPQYHPGPYMYPDHQQYEWPPMPARRAPRAPAMRAMYTEDPREDVQESAEAAVARGFAALVNEMTVAMGRSLARLPVERRIVPFGGFSRNNVETAAVRGAAPSASPFTIEIPVSVETALTGQIKFLEWLTTQCATNVHHAHHAAFIAALNMARAAARYTRLVYRQTGGTGSVYDEPELQPLSDRASALAAFDHLQRYVIAEKATTQDTRQIYKEKLKALNPGTLNNIGDVVKLWREQP
jgi:hypothetical protein